MTSLTTMTATSALMRAGAEDHHVSHTVEPAPVVSRTARAAFACAGAVVSLSLIGGVVFGMTAHAETTAQTAAAVAFVQIPRGSR
jgi:hypothetical protein